MYSWNLGDELPDCDACTRHNLFDVEGLRRVFSHSIAPVEICQNLTEGDVHMWYRNLGHKLVGDLVVGLDLFSGGHGLSEEGPPSRGVGIPFQFKDHDVGWQVWNLPL